MPATQQREKFSTEEAERFAALWAGFEDMSNEAEAMGKARALRRMLAGKTLDDGKALRLVDALELPEIRAALDAQLQPVRNKENPDAEAAFLQIAELAEIARGQEVIIQNLRRQMAGPGPPAGLFERMGEWFDRLSDLTVRAIGLVKLVCEFVAGVIALVMLGALGWLLKVVIVAVVHWWKAH
jgi:hypothetical protein